VVQNTFEPPPKFRYDTLEYRPSQIIGIFQIEKISDYPHIVKTTVGDILHKGQVWFRTGSQNGVALYPELKKIFLGEKPVQFTTLNEVQDIRKVYEENGDEIQFVLLEQEEQRLLEGYKIAAYPGTRQKIVVGSGRAELAMLIKPKKE
jgi:hypothetical protein